MCNIFINDMGYSEYYKKEETKMNLGKKYKQLFEGKTRSNDSRLLKESTVDDTFMMKVAELDEEEFFGFLDDVRYRENSPEWTAYTLGWINKRLGQANADLFATGAKIDPDGNIKWTVERG